MKVESSETEGNGEEEDGASQNAAFFSVSISFTPFVLELPLVLRLSTIVPLLCNLTYLIALFEALREESLFNLK